MTFNTLENTTRRQCPLTVQSCTRFIQPYLNPWIRGRGRLEYSFHFAMQPLGHAACNPNITSIIRTPITKQIFETNSFLIPWRNVKYLEIWTVFIDFVNDDNLFRIVVIELFLPTTSSYSDGVFLAVTLRLQWDFWSRQKSSGSVVTWVLQRPDR